MHSCAGPDVGALKPTLFAPSARHSRAGANGDDPAQAGEMFWFSRKKFVGS